MPTYEYECDACEHAFEQVQRMSDPAVRKCPKCGKLKVRRLISGGAAVIFKGSGFYETDYKRKRHGTAASGSRDASSSSPDSKGSGESKSTGDAKSSGESKSGESKSTDPKSGAKPAKDSGGGSKKDSGGKRD